jgi:hypothetical protein
LLENAASAPRKVTLKAGSIEKYNMKYGAYPIFCVNVKAIPFFPS